MELYLVACLVVILVDIIWYLIIGFFVLILIRKIAVAI